MQFVDAHPDIEDAAQGMKEAVKDLGHTLEEAASESGVVSGLIDSIGKAVAEVSYSIHHMQLTDDRKGKSKRNQMIIHRLLIALD